MINIERLFVLITAFLISLIISAQELKYQSIEWDTIKVDYAEIENYIKENSAVVLKDYKTYEYHYTGSNPYLYETIHKKVLVTNEKGVSYFNKVYIPADNLIDLLNVKIRTISPSGETSIFDEENIKTIENLDDNGSYKIFAIDNLQKGSILELLYTMKKTANISGRYVFQDKYPVLDAKFELYSPQNLVFDAKVYNCNLDRVDSLVNGKLFQQFNFKNLKPYKEEKYSAWKSELIRVDFILAANTSSQTQQQNSWNSYATRLNNQYCTFNKKELKYVKKIIKTLNLKDLNSEQKIRTIENYIKTNIEMKNLGDYSELSDITFVLNYGFTNDYGLIRTFAAFFMEAGIDYSLVFTSDRFIQKFDSKFPNSRFLHQPLFYMPQVEKYIMPIEKYYRLGDMDPHYSDSEGLFLNRIKIDKSISVIPDIKYISSNTMNQNFTRQTIDISFDTLINFASVNYKYEISGREADYIRPYFSLLDDEKQDKALDQILDLMGDDTKVLEKSASNYDNTKSCIDEVFTIDSKFQVASLIENADQEYLFKIGEVIGAQVEMYDSLERIYPIVLKHRHYYDRSISVTIPSGYNVEAYEQLRINNEYELDGKKIMGFISDYSLNDNILNVKIYEYYDFINLDASEYPQFRKVINAAADFNKISLLFVKK